MKKILLCLFASVLMVLGVATACSNPAEIVDKLEVTTQPKKVYVEGEKFDPSGMKVYAVYKDEHRELLKPADYTINPDINTPLTTDVTTVTITHKASNKTVTISITVNAKTVQSIKLLTKPTKIAYSNGEVFNPAGLTLEAKYNNGETATISAQDVTFPNTPLTGTEDSITVTYQGKSVLVPLKTIVPASDEGFGGYDHPSSYSGENNKMINFFNPNDWTTFGTGSANGNKNGVAPVWDEEEKALKFTTETTRLRFDWFREANTLASYQGENAFDNIAADVRDHFDDKVMTYSINLKTEGEFMLYLFTNANCNIDFTGSTTGNVSTIRISYANGQFVIDSPYGGPGNILASAPAALTEYTEGQYNRFDFVCTRKNNEVTIRLYINETRVIFTSAQNNGIAGTANTEGNFVFIAGKHDSENNELPSNINYGHRFGVVPSSDLYLKAVE